MKLKRVLALALIVAASVAMAELFDLFGGITNIRTLEDLALDARQRTTVETFQDREGRTRESDVVLVLFDEFTVMDTLDGWAYLSPFPRQHIADVIDALVIGGARTIGLDVYLDRLFPGLDGDGPLHDAMERAGNVILVSPMEETEEGRVLVPPHPYFEQVAADVGTAELPAAFETLRDGTLAVRSRGRLEASFALAMYAHFKGIDTDSLLSESRGVGQVSLPGIPNRVGEVPESWFEEGAASQSTIIPFRVRFAGPPSSADADAPVGTFPAYASSSVVTMKTELPFLLPTYFEDKIVLIGTGFHNEDKFRTPFYSYVPSEEAAGGAPQQAAGYMFGVETHAHALQNMLDEEFVTPLGAGSKLLVLLVLATVTGGAAFWKGAWTAGAATVLAVAGVLAFAWWAWAGSVYMMGGPIITFSQRFVWVPVFTPMLAGIFSYVGSVAYVAVVEGKEKRFIKSAFGKYVSPEVVAQIAEHPEALQLGGQKRMLSMLFSDLAGFTTLSERLDPQDLLAKLNEYLTDMTQIVMDEGGTLDKYIGDAIMAFWNAPTAVEDHADRCMRTAILMQRKMHDLNARWRKVDPDHEELVVRIGMNSGEVVVGNVGGKDRFDYSAIGDAVNLASRLEPANKTYDTLTMVSDSTLQAGTAARFRVRELDYLAVKGKEEPVKVYELLEMAGEVLSPEKETALQRFREGMAKYKAHHWAAAKLQFEAALEASPDDGPSAVYVARCEANIDDPPPPDWDFVVRRTTK